MHLVPPGAFMASPGQSSSQRWDNGVHVPGFSLRPSLVWVDFEGNIYTKGLKLRDFTTSYLL